MRHEACYTLVSQGCLLGFLGRIIRRTAGYKWISMLMIVLIVTMIVPFLRGRSQLFGSGRSSYRSDHPIARSYCIPLSVFFDYDANCNVACSIRALIGIAPGPHRVNMVNVSMLTKLTVCCGGANSLISAVLAHSKPVSPVV